MASIIDTDDSGTTKLDLSHSATIVDNKLYLLLSKEEDDEQFTIEALNLPGCVSCGYTETEAIANIKEAAAGLLHAYIDAGQAVPWATQFDRDTPNVFVVSVDA